MGHKAVPSEQLAYTYTWPFVIEIDVVWMRRPSWWGRGGGALHAAPCQTPLVVVPRLDLRVQGISWAVRTALSIPVTMQAIVTLQVILHTPHTTSIVVDTQVKLACCMLSSSCQYLCKPFSHCPTHLVFYENCAQCLCHPSTDTNRVEDIWT